MSANKLIVSVLIFAHFHALNSEIFRIFLLDIPFKFSYKAIIFNFFFHFLQQLLYSYIGQILFSEP